MIVISYILCIVSVVSVVVDIGQTMLWRAPSLITLQSGVVTQYPFAKAHCVQRLHLAAL